jgi:hypothetical protein
MVHALTRRSHNGYQHMSLQSIAMALGNRRTVTRPQAHCAKVRENYNPLTLALASYIRTPYPLLLNFLTRPTVDENRWMLWREPWAPS